MAKGWGTMFEEPVPGDVLKCLDEMGVDYRVLGDEAQGKCPAHLRITGKADRMPSWSVNVESGDHNCFSCGFKGPFVGLVREVLSLDQESAVAWIKARGSIDRAKKILQGGGVLSLRGEEDEHEITEADLALYNQVPVWACDNRDLNPAVVDEYGVLWDSKKDRWIIPIRDPFTGHLWGWQEKGEESRYFRNYPPEVTKSLTWFGIHQFLGKTAIIVESPLDVIKIGQVKGMANKAVAGFGVHISDAQVDLLCEIGVETVISALDNDRDANTANDLLRSRVRGRLRLKFWNYDNDDVKDPGDQTDGEIIRSYETAYSSILWKKP